LSNPDPHLNGHPTGLGRPAGPRHFVLGEPVAPPPPAPEPARSRLLPQSAAPTGPGHSFGPPAADPEVPHDAAAPRRSRPLLTMATALALGALLGSATTGLVTGLSVAPEQAPAPAAVDQGTGTTTTASAAQRVLPSVVQVRAGSRGGSGVVIDDSHVVTNGHVVVGASTVELLLDDGRSVTGRVLGADERNDIAVVEADLGNTPAAALGSSAALQIGQPVIAVGSPLGLTGSVTAGVVSAVDRSSGNYPGPMVQTDASINQGNSGGPLVDLRGQVVGINTAIATVGSSGNIGIGFAVPIDRAADVAGRIIARA
jgi:putative serine protease PepD